MLTGSDTKFYGTPLFSYTDNLVTKSTLTIDHLVIQDQYGVKCPRLRFVIRGVGNVQCSASMVYQDVYEFLSKVQSTFENNYKQVSTKIETGDISACINTRLKVKDVNFIISYLWMSEYSGICARIIMSKNESYVDSDKIYLPIVVLTSIIRLVNDYRNNYSLMSAFSLIASNQTSILESIGDLRSKVSYLVDRYEKTSIQDSLSFVHSDLVAKYNNEKEELDQPSMVELNSAVEHVGDAIIASSSSSLTEEEKSAQSELENFFATNEENIKKDFEAYTSGMVSDSPKVQPVVQDLYDYDFTEKFLKNDAKNLEIFLSVASNTNAPMISWRNLFKRDMNIDMFDGVSSSTIQCVDYACSCYVKNFIKLNIEKQQEFPGMVSTIFVGHVNSNVHALSTALDLLLYFIYFSQVRSAAKEKSFNAYTNKDFINFALKALSSPFVFCHAITSTQDVLVNEIVKRYQKYRDNHVFDNVERELKDKIGLSFRFDIGVLKTEVSRLYNAFKKLSGQLTTKDTYNTFNCLKLSFEDITNNIFTDEQIEKLVLMNFDSSEVASMTDFPESILEKFGIKIAKTDTRNLIRYIKSICPDPVMQKKALDVASKINQSYLDILNSDIDFAQFSDNILKAFYFWDVNRYDNIQTNYIYYTDLINKSSLTKPQLMSLLKTDLTETSDFSDSFMAARDD